MSGKSSAHRELRGVLTQSNNLITNGPDMKNGLICFGLCAAISLYSQSKVEKTIPVQAGQKLILDMDFPSLNIQTWERKEVQINGTVSINRGENDGAFELRVDQQSGQLSVTSALLNEKSITQRIMISKDDQEYYFMATRFDDPIVQEFLKEKGQGYAYMSIGIVKEISLEIFVPKNMDTEIRAKYGLVEVKGFDAPLRISATYGKVDATITASTTGEIVARSRHGEILTNLDIKFDQLPFAAKKHDHWTEISARPGKGPRYAIEAKHGNVYLRKPGSQ